MSWYPQACPVCLGGLYDDLLEGGWVTCMMCARSFVAADVFAVQRAVRLPVEQQEQAWIPDRLAS